jgi:tetratricopeptide (TPR) repeat protein
MSCWQYALKLDCGLALLSGNVQSVTQTVEGPRLQLDVCTPQTASSDCSTIFESLITLVASNCFAAKGPEIWLPELPLPWRGWLEASSMPSTTDLLGAELALELWLLPMHEPHNLSLARETLEQRRPTLPVEVREALAYWLLFSSHPPGGRPDLKKSWRADIDEVLVMRSPGWASRRNPPEPLLSVAHHLMTELVRLRNLPVTLVEYEEVITRLGNELSPLPEAYRQAVWWEAGYQLAARGRHADASQATLYYRESCDRLQALLPGLEASGIPGYGIGIGQRAYYAGEFGQALDAYKKEWDSGTDRHRSRLKRLLANVLTDLGMLAKAASFAAEGLHEQEISGDPEAFKTRGRSAEIALRAGKLDKAEALYRLSLAEQTEMFSEDGIDGQTQTYLGHVALLSGRPDEAAVWYESAHVSDSSKDARLNAYTLMGEAALALRRQAHAEVLKMLDRLETTENVGINGDALPRALITIAGVLAGAPREKGLAAIDSLLKANYIVEALACLQVVFRQVDLADKMLNRIASQLKQWDRVIDGLKDFVGPQEPCEPNPKTLLKLIERMRKHQTLKLPTENGINIFPVSLVVPTIPE